MPGKLRSRQSSLPFAVRHLSLGGALSAIGDAAYSYVPPIKMPVLNVRKAAPIDVAAAWDSADTEGLEVGTKFQDGLNTSMKEGMKDVQMAAFRYAEIEQGHQEFARYVAQQSASDPAYFASRANQDALRQMSGKLIDKTKINAAANEFKMMTEDEKEMRRLGRQGDVAMIAGLPTDYTTNDFYRDYQAEQSPAIMRQLFRKRYAKGADGNLYETGESPLRLDAPNGVSKNDAEGELTTLQNFIKADSKETGGTSFYGSVNPAIKALYEAQGGSAAGYRTTDNTSKQESNLKMINALRNKFNADPGAWRQYVTPGAQQALIADHYRQVAAEYGGTSAAEIVNGKQGRAVLDAGGGLRVDLSGNHLEVRRRLAESSNRPNLDPAQQKMIDEAYKKLYAHDLQAAETSVSNLFRQRLSLGGYTETSDVSRSQQHDQGLTPPAGKEGSDNGLDLHGMVQFGGGNWRSDRGKSDGKETAALWSLDVSGNGEFEETVRLLTQNADGSARTLGQLNREGKTIYNAKTMEGIAWGRNGDSGLDKAKVVPGSGTITLMPKDPTQFRRKTEAVKQMEAEAKEIQKHINELEVIQSKRQLTADERRQANGWVDRQRQAVATASTRGYVPTVTMRAIVPHRELTNIPSIMRSVSHVPDFNQKVGMGMFGDLSSQDSDATGVRNVTKDEAIKAGFDTRWYAPDDFAEVEVMVGVDNFQALGSRESVKENNAIQSKVNNRAATQSGAETQNRYGN